MPSKDEAKINSTLGKNEIAYAQLNEYTILHDSLSSMRNLDKLEEIQLTGDIFFPKGWLSSSVGRYSSKEAFAIVQGFLNTHPGRTVRVRIKGNKGYLTVKGEGNTSGTTRFEWEKEITTDEARALVDLCEPGILEKIRYEVPVGKHLYEVDEFFGENKGLVVAEIELKDEEENFIKPDWLGKEVTGEVKYYNSQLSKRPFLKW